MNQIPENYPLSPEAGQLAESPVEQTPVEPLQEQTPNDQPAVEQAPGDQTSVEQVPSESEQSAETNAEPSRELTEEETKLRELLAIAVKDGVDKAVAVAKELDPRIQDMFHDTLMDYPELKAQLEASGKMERL